MAEKNDAASIKRRTEALVATASMNVQNHGGDAATAAADLMCAFVLISMRCGMPPEAAIEAMAKHAIAACADFWGLNGRKLDG